MKAYTISNGFRQGREAAFGALLMELCIGGERIASFLGITQPSLSRIRSSR